MEQDEPGITSLIEATWKKAIDSDRNHDALIIGIIAYLESRIRGEKVDEDGALGMIHVITDNMLYKRNLNIHACSFCGRQPPEVRLGGGGHNVNICESCVELFNQSFQAKT